MTTTPTVWKPASVVNPGSPPGSVQARPQILGLADGRILVMWQDNVFGSDPGRDIVGGIHTPEGSFANGVFVRLNSALNNGDEVNVKAAALPDGGFVVAYADAVAHFMIVVERYDANGARVFFDLVTDGEESLNAWDIVADAQGNYTLVYEKDTLQFAGGGQQPEPDVFSTRWSFNGNTRGPELNRAAQNTEEPDWLAAAAILPSGNLAVLSRDDDAYGFPIPGFPKPTTELTITNPVTGQRVRDTVQIAGDGDIAATPLDIAGLAGGQIVMVFRETIVYSSGPSDRLYFRIAQSETPGSPIGAKMLLPGFGDRVQQEARVVGLKDGGFFVAWVEDNISDIRGQRYSTTGLAIGSVLTIAGDVLVTGTETRRVLSDLSLSSDGRILLAYQTQGNLVAQVILDPRQTIRNLTEGPDIETTQSISSEVRGLGGGDTIYGQGGDDLLMGDAGRDTLFGGRGADRIRGGTEADYIQGGGGDDVLNGDEGNDLIDGGDGADRIDGSAGRDVLRGREGDDTYILSSAEPYLFTRVFDTIEETGASAGDSVVVTSLTPGLFVPSFYVLPGRIENGTIAGGYGFSLFGNDLANRLTGNAAGNTLQGGAGPDRLDGGAGDDRLGGGLDDDILIGGAGLDAVDWSGATGPISHMLGDVGTGTAVIAGLGRDTYLSVEGAIGGAFDDSLAGTDAANLLEGGGGRDRLSGGFGDDTLSGGDETGAGDISLSGGGGSDVIRGGGGGDRIDGGEGDDIGLLGETGNDVISGGAGSDAADGGPGDDIVQGNGERDQLRGGEGADTLYGGDENGAGDSLLAGDAGNDHVQGGAGADRLDGGAGNDRLYGEAGGDTATGGDGNDFIDGGEEGDTLLGQAGIDNLFGGLGNDLVDGGADNDNMTGGGGADTFDFNSGTGSERVQDFTNDVDTLRIDPILGFATAAAVVAATIAAGADARVVLGGGQNIFLTNYLLTNTIASLADDIVIG